MSRTFIYAFRVYRVYRALEIFIQARKNPQPTDDRRCIIFVSQHVTAKVIFLLVFFPVLFLEPLVKIILPFSFFFLQIPRISAYDSIFWFHMLDIIYYIKSYALYLQGACRKSCLCCKKKVTYSSLACTCYFQRCLTG